jgi:hypothetical protein
MICFSLRAPPQVRECPAGIENLTGIILRRDEHRLPAVLTCVVLMLAARWVDDGRMKDPSENRPLLSELVNAEPEAWAMDSFEIATKIAYQNGALGPRFCPGRRIVLPLSLFFRFEVMILRWRSTAFSPT